MAEDKKNYPQIPNRVWWEVRSLLQNRPSAKLTDSILATQLSVQLSAAKAYLNQFRLVGLLDDDGGATELAKKWRIDDSYEEAKQKILEHSYPDELVSSFPANRADIQKVADWFELGGLGSGTARNKASTYILIANGKPKDAESTSPVRDRAKSPQQPKSKRSQEPSKSSEQKKVEGRNELPELNVNVQIHISADASNEQIEKIFESMRKYLWQ